MSDLKISIIITVYNRVHLLRNALLSIKGQSFVPYEIIISDDGSSEDIISGISDILSEFNCKIKYVTQDDLGFRLARCRNNAVRVSEGDYLIFLDQDLMFTRNFLREFKESVRDNYFTVGYPIRLTKEQSENITLDVIKNCSYNNIVTKKQTQKVLSQFKKDRLYRILNSVYLRKYGTKFRGGVTGFFKKDYLEINGYDEKFIGWGNEDDDFGRRLYASGIKGYNPFKDDYPLHHWHKEFHNNGERVNKKYNDERSLKINKSNYKCEFGFNNTYGDDKYKLTILK